MVWVSKRMSLRAKVISTVLMTVGVVLVAIAIWS